MASSSYLIVGAGVFGASTALHLIRKYPGASITLLDRNAFDATARVAASWDWNKLVRAEYSDIDYMRLGLEARAAWKEDPLWRPFYHETGVFWATRTGFAQEVAHNYTALGVETELSVMPVENARLEYGGLLAEGDYEGISEVLINRTSGVADAKDALQRIIEETVALGVKYVQAEVATLEFEDGVGGGCRGVRTRDGSVIVADRIVLCTGAFTARLLADSAPERTDLQAGGRIIAAAVSEGVAPLTEEQVQKYSGMPVTITWNPPGRGTNSPRLVIMWLAHSDNLTGADNGCLLYNRGKLLKFWGQCIFTNMTQHPSTKAYISTPPPGPDYGQWDVPVSLQNDIHVAKEAILGQNADELRLEQFRICW